MICASCASSTEKHQMKICDSWLQDWIEHGLDMEGLAHRLTMLGLEVESVVPVGAPLENVVVGRVIEVRRHPNADKLSLCRVDVGIGEPLGIVCGAGNVREGGLYPVAVAGATLVGGSVIKAARIRGEPSAGMLCSAAELGLDSSANGLLDLDAGAAPGTDVNLLLRLDDSVLDVNITPNRADCFSISGIAREVGSSGARRIRERPVVAVPAANRESFPLRVTDPADCPRFAGRVIRGLRAEARTPLWMRERLRRCGVRAIHPVVDVTNYVMLELGQPMHAYDLARLKGRISVRRGAKGESLALLDGQIVEPDADVLVIADDGGPIGLAGIMGGSATAVSLGTEDVFLESAFFAPQTVAGRARRFGLHTDASVRFERGVDPSLQAIAIERASSLIVEIAGGAPGPVADLVDAGHLPGRVAVRLRRNRMALVLGAVVPDIEVTGILSRLGMLVVASQDGWTVTPPPARFDIEREEDLIEEVARVFGYERISAVSGNTAAHPARAGESIDPRATIAASLVARGYREAITYSFVEPALARLFGAHDSAHLTLSNPISIDLAVMRQSLWPGLVKAARENLNRQQARVRLFEIGSRFIEGAGADHREEPCVAGVVIGTRLPEQWGAKSEPVDVFDVKADVEALLRAAGMSERVTFAASGHPALHPGRTACILSGDGTVMGWLGEVHPAVASELEIPMAVLFEVQMGPLLEKHRPSYRSFSRFPAVRRDVAVVVSRELPAAALLATVRSAAPETLREAFVFDIYTGKQIGESEKSVAIGLILQDTSRTLTDEDADGVLQTVRAALSRELQAKIRQ
jgi:phenylalanyl-tRNA synthetase beta chain